MPCVKRVVSVVLVLLAVSTVVAFAQQAALSDEQVRQRLTFITKALEDGRPAAQRWYYGWIGLHTAGAVGAGILAGSHWHDTKLEGSETVPDRELAEGLLVGGATFAVGVGSMLVDPFTPATAAGKLGRLPEGSPEERLAKLARAEELLRKCARRERRGRNVTTHVLSIGTNAAAAVVTKVGFHHSWGKALITFAAGEAVSLLNIFTQPMKATRDLKAYEAGFAAGEPSARPGVQWSLGLGPGGVSFSLRF